MVDDKIWLLLILGAVLWALIDGRKKRPIKSNKVKRLQLFRDRPAGLKDAIYHPKEWRRPRK